MDNHILKYWTGIGSREVSSEIANLQEEIGEIS